MLSCSHTSNMLSHCSPNFLICTWPFAWICSSGNVDTSKSLVPSCLPWSDLKAVSVVLPMVLPLASHQWLLLRAYHPMRTLESPYPWFPSCTDGTAVPGTWGPPRMYTWIKSHWKWTLDLPEMSVCTGVSSVFSPVQGRGGISKRYLFNHKKG